MVLGPLDLSKVKRCDNLECKARLLCEMPDGKLPPPSIPYMFHPDAGCDHYYPVEDLRSEGLRDNPRGSNYQFDARTKRHRRKGGLWN